MRSDTPIPRSGELLAGRYRVGASIGRGRSTVYRAEDTRLQREVAVKEVRLADGHEDHDRARRRVMREAHATARLNHPHVVTVFDVIESPDAIWLVMELVDAPSLSQLVADHGPLDHGRVARMGLAVLSALEAAHAEGVIHRDVKPANVLVERDDHTKLADFGVATIRDETRVTATGMVVGSPAYMAPEQARGEQVTSATDLWGLGATLYFAVEGVAPFDGPTALATASAVVHGAPRPVRHRGPLTPVIARLLDKDPAHRPAAAGLRQQLARATGGSRRRLLRRLGRSAEPVAVPGSEGPPPLTPPEPGVPAAEAEAGTTTPAEPAELAEPAEATKQAEPVAPSTARLPSTPIPDEESDGDAAPAGSTAPQGGDLPSWVLPSATSAASTAQDGEAAGSEPVAQAAEDPSAPVVAAAAEDEPDPGAGDRAADDDASVSAAAAPGVETEEPAPEPAPEEETAAGDGEAEPAGTPLPEDTSSAAHAEVETAMTAVDGHEGAAAVPPGEPGHAADDLVDDDAVADDAAPPTAVTEPAPVLPMTEPSGPSVAERPSGLPTTEPTPGPPAAEPAPMLPASEQPPVDRGSEVAVSSGPLAGMAEPAGRRRRGGLRPAERQGLVGAAVLVVILLVGLAVWTLGPGGGDDGGDAGQEASGQRSTTTAPSTTAGDDAGTTGAPGGDDPGGEAEGGEGRGQGRDEGRGEGPPSSPATTAPAPAAAPGAPQVPQGWAVYENPEAGYSVAHPPGWQVVPASGPRIDIREPGTGTYLRLDWTATPQSDPVADWEAQSQTFANRHDNYETIRIETYPYRDYNAAIWEFRYRDGGADLHAANIGFVVGGTRGYALLFQTREERWAASQDVFAQIQASFRPAP